MAGEDVPALDERLLAADGGGLLAADGGGRGGGVPPVHTEISVKQRAESSAKIFEAQSSVRRRCKESGEGTKSGATEGCTGRREWSNRDPQREGDAQSGFRVLLEITRFWGLVAKKS
ncbi:hypothetical protein Scep_011229 [Stephania cephalantha]|uniref:Uncharacterized protein n=1 Tax=Stephania cephalantha TaxID=152367 RepID=A0AAP0JEI9_9MAGN